MMKSYGQADLSFCGVPRDADWTLVIPDPMLRVGSALGFSHTQPEHAQRGIENGASIARDARDAVTIFCPAPGQKIVQNGIPEWDTRMGYRRVAESFY